MTTSGERVRIDRANNVFVDGECQNPTKYGDLSLEENAEDYRGNMIEEGARRIDGRPIITGHVGEFTYTKYDDNGKPYQYKVVTGYPSQSDES